ncbi:uncharacterized mitochondrial protein-like protein [Tanacetum coccineum]
MITTSNKIEGRKPSGLMETMDIMDLIPCVGSLHCIKQDLALSGEVILFYKGTVTNTSDGLAAIQAQLNNLGREIKKVNERVRLINDGNEEKMVLVRLMDREKSGTSLKKLLMEKLRMGYQIEASTNMHDSTILEDSLSLKEKDLGSFTISCYINNICFEKALANLGSSVSVMPYSTFINLDLGELAPTKLIIELADRTIKHPKGIAENVLVGIDKFIFPIDFIVLDMPEDIKVPLILRRPFFSTAHAKIDVFKRKITLRVGDDKIMFRNLLTTFMEIELNDLNEPLELRRNHVEDLGPTIEVGEVIDKPMEDMVETRNDDNEISNGIDEYPSFWDFDRKIHIDCAYNLFYSSIMKHKIEYKGKNVVGAFINVPIFVGNFSVVTDFAVVGNMDAYRTKGMGDVIVGKPFCREICIKARRFDGMISIYNGNDGVTYQMA